MPDVADCTIRLPYTARAATMSSSGQLTNQRRFRSFTRYLDASVAVTCSIFCPRHAARICRAAGPATDPPCPPCSITTTTAVAGLLGRSEADEPGPCRPCRRPARFPSCRRRDTGNPAKAPLPVPSLVTLTSAVFMVERLRCDALVVEGDRWLCLEDRLALRVEHLLQDVRLHHLAAVGDSRVGVERAAAV